MRAPITTLIELPRAVFPFVFSCTYRVSQQYADGLVAVAENALPASSAAAYWPNTTACMMRPGTSVNSPAITSAPVNVRIMIRRCALTS